MSPNRTQRAAFIRKRNEHVDTLNRWVNTLENTLPEDEDMLRMLHIMAMDLEFFKDFQYSDTCKIWSDRCETLSIALLVAENFIGEINALDDYTWMKMTVLVLEIGRLTPNGTDETEDPFAAECADTALGHYGGVPVTRAFIDAFGEEFEEAWHYIWDELHLFDQDCLCLQCSEHPVAMYE